MAAARSEHLYSASPVTLEQSVCRAWRLWGRAADLLSSEQERPVDWALQASACPGGGRTLGCVPALCSPTCAVGFSLPAG